jgi:protein-S-isoprenylcysteine O-methyltransferase Ste14
MFIVAISYLAWLTMECWILLRDRRAVAGERVDRGSRWLIVAIITVCLWLAFTFGYRMHPAWLPLPSASLPVGLAAMWLGMGLRLWAVVTLGIHFRTAVIVQQQHQLIEQGPYTHVRNPSYSGSLLTLLGIGLTLGNALSLLLLFAGPLLAYLWRIRVEERALARHFGERYVRYRARTWALIPGIW